MIDKYLNQTRANKDVKDIKHSDLYNVLKTLYNPTTQSSSRLETMHRLIQHLIAIFKLAMSDEYITINPAEDLHSKFPTSKRFNENNSIDSRVPAITDKKDLKDFLQDLKNNTTLDITTKNAIYIQILSINRRANTVQAKNGSI